MKKNLLLTLTLFAFGYVANAQTVTITDTNFKNYLLGNTAINTGGSPTEIETSEATAFTGKLDCKNLGITDMTGLEAFVNIRQLDVSDNTGLTSLSLTGLSDLDSLYTSNTAIVTLVVSPCDSLEKFIATGMTALTDLNLKGVEPYVPAIPAIPAIPGIFAGRPASDATGTLDSINFDVRGATSLTCIEVDDTQTAGLRWVNKDDGASYATDCSIVQINSITVTGTDGDTTVTVLGTLQMVATILPSNYGDTYTWSILTLNAPAEAMINSSGLVTGIITGTVVVTASADNGNVTGIATIVITEAGVGDGSDGGAGDPNGIEETTSISLQVYPNPAADQLTIISPESIQSVTITDITGRVVKTVAGNSNIVNVSDLTAGIYTLTIQTAGGTSNARFVKE